MRIEEPEATIGRPLNLAELKNIATQYGPKLEYEGYVERLRIMAEEDRAAS